MIHKVDFLKTYNMGTKDIIEYLKKVYDDVNTGGDKGYFDAYRTHNDEIVGRVQGMKGNNYYKANDLLEKINDAANNNLGGLEELTDD